MAFTFVHIYLFRLSHSYRAPALHQMFSYIFIPVGYALAGVVSRRFGLAAAFRCGLAAYALYSGGVLWLGESSVDHIVELGALYGLGAGLYWQGWILLVVDLSTEQNRDAMLASNQMAYFFAGITAAPLAGWYLSRFEGTGGYMSLFALSLLLLAAAWWVSLPLKGRPLHGSSSMLRVWKARKPAGWNASLASAALMGFMSVGAMFLPVLISYETGGTEGHSGAYAALTALAGLGAAWGVARLAHPERRSNFLLYSALGIAALVLPLALTRDYSLVLLYGLGMAMTVTVFNVPLFASQIKVLESSPRLAHRRADAMLLREVPLNVGRVIACVLLIWGVKGLASPVLSAFFIILAALPLANYFLMRPFIGSRLDSMQLPAKE